jgi:hypothetical protein
MLNNEIYMVIHKPLFHSGYHFISKNRQTSDILKLKNSFSTIATLGMLTLT